MSNLRMGLCGELAKSTGWSTFQVLRWIVPYPVDKVIRSLNNWGLNEGLQHFPTSALVYFLQFYRELPKNARKHYK